MKHKSPKKPKNVPFAHISREELQICVPLVTDNFSARETPHRYNLRQEEDKKSSESKKNDNVGGCSPFL
jgi:hypothetical protein